MKPLNSVQKNGTLAASMRNGKVELRSCLLVNTYYPVCWLSGQGWIDGPEQVKNSGLAGRNVAEWVGVFCTSSLSSFSITNWETVLGPRISMFSLHTSKLSVNVVFLHWVQLLVCISIIHVIFLNAVVWRAIACNHKTLFIKNIFSGRQVDG